MGRRNVRLFAARVVALYGLNPALDIANVVEVFVEAVLIVRPDGLPQAGGVGEDRVENAGRGAPFARAEKPFEDEPRVDYRRKRSGGRGPANGVGVDAVVAKAAGVGRIEMFDAELERLNSGLLREMSGLELIDGNAAAEIRAGGLFGSDAGEEDGAGSEVIGTDFG